MDTLSHMQLLSSHVYCNVSLVRRWNDTFWISNGTTLFSLTNMILYLTNSLTSWFYLSCRITAKYMHLLGFTVSVSSPRSLTCQWVWNGWDHLKFAEESLVTDNIMARNVLKTGPASQRAFHILAVNTKSLFCLTKYRSSLPATIPEHPMGRPFGGYGLYGTAKNWK